MTAMVSRRSLLLTGVALAAIGGGVGLSVRGAPAPGLSILTPTEVEITEAIARVLFPPGIFPVAGGDGGTAPMVDHILSEIVDPKATEPFCYLLRAIQIGTLFSRGRSFSSLDPEEAASVLEIWASDEPFPRRLASDSFKIVLGMAFFHRPEVVAAIGWRSGCSPHEDALAPEALR